MGIKYNEKQQKVDILTLGRLRVLDEKGEPQLISHFWKENPAVFIFLRHFSCIACRAHVDQVWKRKEEFKKSNTQIVFIGHGSADMIKTFKDDMNVHDAPIFTDPSMETFDACGFNRNPLRLIDPRGVLKIQELRKKGYSQGPIDSDTGHHFQMGGVVAFRPPGKVVYHFISQYLGDQDTPEDWKGEA